MSTVYDLETKQEKSIRRIATFGGLGVLVLIIFLFVVPLITKALVNGIKMSIAAAILGAIVFVGFTIWNFKDILYARYKSWVRKGTRFLVKTDLPGLLEVVIENRQKMLQKFSDSVGKMRKAIMMDDEKIKERKILVQENLDVALQFQKQATAATEDHEKTILSNKAKYHSGQAVEDKKMYDTLSENKIKKEKAYQFFDLMRSNLDLDTKSVIATIDRLKTEMASSNIWKSAANTATGLLGVSDFEKMTLEETRKKIMENEAEVMNFVYDNENLLSKMEANSGIMDEKGQQLLEQYSNKVDVFQIGVPADNSKPITSLTDNSWITQNKKLLK